MFPLDVQFRDMDSSDFVYNSVFENAEKLERFFDKIISCHVVISAPHQKHKTKNYHVQIHLSVPGKDIYVNRDREIDDAHSDVYVAIRDSFAAATRQLEEHVRKLRGETKAHHNAQGVGTVEKIFPIDGYGFLETPEGREIYFHENSLLNCKIQDVRLGDQMVFSEEMGDKGPQASSLKRIG